MRKFQDDVIPRELTHDEFLPELTYKLLFRNVDKLTIQAIDDAEQLLHHAVEEYNLYKLAGGYYRLCDCAERLGM